MLKKSLALLCCLMLAVSPLVGVPLPGVLKASAADSYVWEPDLTNATLETYQDQNTTKYLSAGGKNLGIRLEDANTADMTVNGGAIELTANSGTYKSVIIETGSGVGGTSYFRDSDYGFAPAAGTEYEISFDARVATDGVTSPKIGIQVDGSSWIQYDISESETTISCKYTQAGNGGNVKISTVGTSAPVTMAISNLKIEEVAAESGGNVDGDGTFSAPIEIPIANWSKSKELASFENGTVTYGTQDYANAYIYANIPATPENYPNLHSFTFSYQGPDRYAEEAGNGLGGSVRLLAVTASEATGDYMGGDSWVEARTIGKVTVSGGSISPVERTMVIDREKLASLGAVKRFVLYLPSGTKINGNTTSFTYSNISVVFSVDCCDGKCTVCDCETEWGWCKFTGEGQCCYAPPPPTSPADNITVDASMLKASGAATLNGNEVTLTVNYDADSFVYFDVAIPEGNSIYDYSGLSLTFKGISGDNQYKSLQLAAGAPEADVGAFSSYTKLAADVGNKLTGSTGSAIINFTFNEKSLRELHAADLPVVRFAIYMHAEANTVFTLSDITLISKSYEEKAPTLPGDNYVATGSVGRHALTKYGYDYELWSQMRGDPPLAPGYATMNIPTAELQAGKGGIFNAFWKDTYNVLIRSGKKFTDSRGIKIGTTSTVGESYAELGEFVIDFETDWATSDDVAYLSVYGWAFFKPGSEPTKREDGTDLQFSDEIEYYIVQDRKSYNPVGNSTPRGSAVIDGILYDFYVTDRIGQPMLKSDSGNFKQYWSMPRNPADFRQSGTISVSEHFRAWEEAGMLMDGPLYEAAWKVESYTGSEGATGHAYVTKNIFTIDGVELKEASKPSEPSGSSSSSSSGGGGGGGSSAPTIVTSPNVSADGSVNSQAALSDANKALAATGDSAVVSAKNATSISAAALKSLAKAAEKAGKSLILHADTTNADGSIQGRLYVDPAKLTNLTGDLKLGVYTDPAKVAATKAKFEKHFTGKIAVIRCEQQGTFGATLKIAAKVNLSGMDTSKLVFYSYSKETNSYTQIADTAYFIDKNGYLHFYTALAGDIIISEAGLKKK